MNCPLASPPGCEGRTAPRRRLWSARRRTVKEQRCFWKATSQTGIQWYQRNASRNPRLLELPRSSLDWPAGPPEMTLLGSPSRSSHREVQTPQLKECFFKHIRIQKLFTLARGTLSTSNTSKSWDLPNPAPARHHPGLCWDSSVL